ncbi:MAG: hypothetical protein QM640_11885 [Niabella sp.]
MMKFFLSIIIIALICLVAGLYLPWWSVALVAFLIALLVHQKPLLSFLSGFLGVFILWLLLALFINLANAGILANRVGELLGVGPHAGVLIFVTAFTGGLVAGFAALSASYLRRSS